MTHEPSSVHDAKSVKVRAVWALLVAVCLLAAGGTRGVQADDGHHATTISAARHGASSIQRAKILPHLDAIAIAIQLPHVVTEIHVELLERAPVASAVVLAVLARATSPRGPPVA